MNEFLRIRRFLRIGVFMIIAIVLAFMGLKYSIYGIIVHSIGSEVYEISVGDIGYKEFLKRRNVLITGASTTDNFLEYHEEDGTVSSYLYPVYAQSDSSQKIIMLFESKNEL